MRHANGYWHWLRSREVVFTRDANGRPTQVLGTAIDITAEKRLKAAHEQAEATLIDSEARLRAIFNQAAVGIAQTDPSGRFLRVNRWLCDLLGYTPAELLERTVNDITYLCGQEAIPSGMQALLAGEVHDCSFEKRYVCRDGQLRWVNVTISVVRNEQGTPQYFIGVVEDIEQRKQAEAALHESEATNRALLEAIPDLMIRLTRDGTYLNFIPAKDFEILLPDPQLPGKSIYEVMPLAFAQQRMYYVEHAFRSGKTQVYEYELMINGTLRHQEARITVSGTHEALVIVRDITKRKQTEDALYDSEERWQLAIQGNNDGIWDWSLKTGKLFYSTRCREMLGYADPEIEDSFEGWSNLTHPDDLDRVMTALRAYLDRQIPTYMIEYRLRSKDGSYRWVLSRAQALWDEDGSPLRIVGSRSDITDRKNAEDALREKEEQLRLAIDFTQLGTWDWRIPPDQLLWNENTARLLDLPADRLEVTSQDWIDRLHPEDRDWVLEISERALKNRTIYEAEYRVIWNDDSIHWVLGKGHGVYDEAGQVVRMVGVIMDISDRKYAEEALRQSEAQLRTLVENLPFDCWVCDADGRYIIQNLSAIQNWGNMIGYTKAEAGIPGNIRERWQSNEALALAGEVVLDEVQYTSRDQTRTVFSILAPVRDGDMIRGIVGVSIDITARKQAEEALRESEARFRQLAENIQEVFFIYSPDYSQLFYVSPALQKLWGLPPEQLYQNPHLWMDFIHPDDRDHILSQLPSRIEQEYTAEYRLVRSDGEVRWTHIRAFPVQNTQGEIYRIVGLFEDITDRKQSEMMLQQAKDAAEAANRAKSEFLSRMSHELRTPLTAILGFAELIATDSALSQDNQENLAIISRNGTHLLTLINDVLEMSKIEVGKITLDETSFNLYHLIDTVEELLRFKAIAKGLELRIERSINVPQYIQTDKTKLRQVLFNLLDNAIKFTNAGYVILRVRQGDREMRETQDPSPHPPIPSPHLSLTFEIEDTGAGISLEEVTTLFDAFTQTETGRQLQEGTGLGLAISRQFVQLMGGDISIQSLVGQGSTFTFTIQFKPACEGSALSTSSALQRVIGLTTDQPIYRILLVDDQVLSRKILRRILAPLGFDVREAVDGQEAIDQWESWQPHLIWLDLRMPGIDGYEVARIIRARESGQDSEEQTPALHTTKIIALTASAFEEQRSMALAAGCDDFVAKPFQRATLLEKIANHLGVCYLYEDTSGNSEEPVNHQTVPVFHSSNMVSSPTLHPSSLQIMPTAWVTELQTATARLSSSQCLSLIEQIPTEQASFARALTELVDNFQFDVILDLIEQNTEV
ncbi:MAG: PAS domain S-box protein [Cyanobacteria bacterium CRU_2_1]|nr:PAS domain S-box protein [Cyanobacteria bacterium CRU_2_1]